MALSQTLPARGGAAAKLPRPVELVAFALVVAHAVYLTVSYFQGVWPDTAGVPPDFVNVWAGGQSALAGHAAAVYDGPIHKLAEEAAVGHPFDGFYTWHYPPTFLVAAAALALLPYATAFFVWMFATFLAYAAAIRAIIGERLGYLLAAAFPAVLANFLVGQNGFLTAALIGGALLLVERQPVVAGMLLGLLTFKPHLGLLFPIALLAGGHWRVFVAAALTAALIAAASWAAFGTATWQAFLIDSGNVSAAFPADGWTDWGKIQTAFGLVRMLGGSAALAWTAQIAIVLLAAGAIAVLWRSRTASEIKAAALATGAVLATPYLYTYDLVVLAVPLAFLFRLGRERGFLAHEMAGVALACLLILIYPLAPSPVGFAAALVIVALIARRALLSPSGAL